MNTRMLFAVALATLPIGRFAFADVNQPLEIIDRARTLPADELELQVQLLIDRMPGAVAMGTTPATGTTTDTGLGFLAGYGFSPLWEGYLGYGIGLSPSSGRGDILVGTGYNLGKLGPLTAALDAYTGFDTSSEDLTPLKLGLAAQLKLGDTLALFTPGQQFVIALANNEPVSLDLPIAIQYQGAPNVFVDVGTNIAHLGFRGGGTKVFGSDAVPITVDAFYSFSHAFDLGVFMSDDFKSAGDTFEVGFTARAFL